MGNEFQELLEDVQNQTIALKEAAETAKELITPALSKSPSEEDIVKMDKALEFAQGAYLNAKSVYSRYNDNVRLLGTNKKFMSVEKNAAAYKEFTSIRDTNKEFLDMIKTTLDQLELWLLRLKESSENELEQDDDVDMSEQETSEDEQRVIHQQKKCAPKCTIL